MKFIILFLVVFGVSNAANVNRDVDVNHMLSEGDPKIKLVVNDVFDTLIDEIRQFAIDNGLDPMELPDIEDSFRVRLLVLVIRGELSMTNGILYDFATLQREGDAVIEQRKKKVDLNFAFGFKDLIMTYDYRAKLLGIGPKGGIIGTVKDFTMAIGLSLDTGSMQATLTNVKARVGRLDIKFTGTFLLDLVANILSDVITTLFKRVIVRAIEDTVSDAINEALEDFNNKNNSQLLMNNLYFIQKIVSESTYAQDPEFI